MKKVYSSDNLVLCGLVNDILSQANIHCVFKNQYLNGAAGELPLNEVWPEIWVWEEDEQKALLLIEDVFQSPAPYKGPWTCQRCGEVLEEQFLSCWQCNQQRSA